MKWKGWKFSPTPQRSWKVCQYIMIIYSYTYIACMYVHTTRRRAVHYSQLYDTLLLRNMASISNSFQPTLSWPADSRSLRSGQLMFHLFLLSFFLSFFFSFFLLSCCCCCGCLFLFDFVVLFYFAFFFLLFFWGGFVVILFVFYFAFFFPSLKSSNLAGNRNNFTRVRDTSIPQRIIF